MGWLALVAAAFFCLSSSLVVDSATLSNTKLPLDNHGKPLITGETSILAEDDGSYIFYVNDWGGCATTDCCSSPGGCASCCFVPPSTKFPDACVFAKNHSVHAYRTRDFSHWENMGVVLSVSDRPQGIEFRPHVVRPRPGLYVMWFEDRPDAIKSKGYFVASSSGPFGPFSMVKENIEIAGTPGDFDVLHDVQSNRCYHVQTLTNNPKTLNSFAVTELDAGCTTPLQPRHSITFQAPQPSEGPVFFRRKGIWYILAGTTCCACRGGSSVYVFASKGDDPMGAWKYLGDVGRNVTHSYNKHSPLNYVTHAQASSVVKIQHTDTFLWMGNQWVTSKTRNSSLLYWAVLDWIKHDDGVDGLAQFEREESVTFNIH